MADADAEPLPIPRRVALCACAAVLLRREGQLRQRSGASRRRGEDAASRSAARQAGRDAQAGRLGRAAARLYAAAAEPSGERGVDAALLGYLVALCEGWDRAFGELRAELEAAGRPEALAGLISADVAEACLAAIG